MAPARSAPGVTQAMPRIVIVGGGFGGISAARMLARLVADFGSEHKWGYALSAVLLGLIALANTGIALLLKPVVNGLVSVERFGEMRLMAFEAVASPSGMVRRRVGASRDTPGADQPRVASRRITS